MMSCIRMFFMVLGCFYGMGMAWDADDFALFDIVDEVQRKELGTFYQILDIDRYESTTADIRKAYRKLSLKLHPDRNPSPTASDDFRRITAIADVLKSTDLRNRYENILVNGLPNYLYRRVHKLGGAAIIVIVGLFVSVVHYVLLWGKYRDRVVRRDNAIAKLQKIAKNKSKYRSQIGDADVVLPEELYNTGLPALLIQNLDPALRELIMPAVKPSPLQTVLVQLILRSPAICCHIWYGMKDMVPKRKNDLKESRDVVHVDEIDIALVRRRKKRLVIVDDETTEEVVVGRRLSIIDLNEEKRPPVTVTKKPPPVIDTCPSASVDPPRVTGPWSDSELSLLARSMTKYPVGTVSRWDKIARVIKRDVGSCIAKSKELNAITASKRISKPIYRPPPATITSTQTISHAQISIVDSSISWTQLQQCQLESALAAYPVTDHVNQTTRWLSIANAVDGMNAKDCKNRCRELAREIKKKTRTNM